jgi:hypothetical protein
MPRVMAAIASLPRIVRFLGTSDAGGPDAVCPHCGATGRYVHSFECEDGSTRGAMSGCIQLFPVHPIASAALRLSDRERDLRERFGRTAKLNSWDQQIREAIDAFYAGTMDERAAMYQIQCAEQAKRNYRRSRWGR